MVKAYLKYVQHDVVGGFVANTSNLQTCQLFTKQTVRGDYLVTAHNEIVYFTNMASNEIEFKFYSKEAEFGQVTCLKASGQMLAIGYSTGTIIVIDLNLDNTTQDEENEGITTLSELHRFQFHRTSVTSLLFDDQNTILYSGSQDTYIITYDLVADQAQFKLMGHKDAISGLAIFSMQLKNQKQPTKVLISSSKDGFIKMWDLSIHFCIHTYSDPVLSKINDFALLPDLRMLVVANGCQTQQDAMFLNLYEITTS